MADASGIDVDDAVFKASNLSLKTLIKFAYNLKTTDQIVGIEGWANSARFDVNAKMDAETFARLKPLPGRERDKAIREMMQAMLADRFQLKLHHETKELPIYLLTVAKGGPLMKTADPAIEDSGTNTNNHKMTATGVTMESLAEHLADRVHRMIEDKTGLAGKYDFTLEWAPEEAAGEAPKDAGGNTLPSLITAVQEQLGLKLESAKGPVDTIVIDHIAQPTMD